VIELFSMDYFSKQVTIFYGSTVMVSNQLEGVVDNLLFYSRKKILYDIIFKSEINILLFKKNILFYILWLIHLLINDEFMRILIFLQIMELMFSLSLSLSLSLSHTHTRVYIYIYILSFRARKILSTPKSPTLFLV
jgi:hypothetical protein